MPAVAPLFRAREIGPEKRLLENVFVPDALRRLTCVYGERPARARPLARSTRTVTSSWVGGNTIAVSATPVPSSRLANERIRPYPTPQTAPEATTSKRKLPRRRLPRCAPRARQSPARQLPLRRRRFGRRLGSGIR